MQTYALVPHPATPPLAVRRIEARVVAIDAQWLRLRWRIDGPERLVVPAFAGKGRADELWKTTCFEFFVRPSDGMAYVELNLSSSERWNAYDFSGYREGMAERGMPHEPVCTMRRGQSMAIFDAAVPVEGLPALPWATSFACVIEEEGGHRSYWAMAHCGDRPDFHDPACFAGAVPAPGGT